MIQRIQSIYLLLAAASMLAIYNIKLATFSQEDGVWNYFITGIESISDTSVINIATMPVLALTILSAVLFLIAIFLYTNRKLQIKIALFGGMISLLFYPIALIYFWYGRGAVEATSTTIGAAVAFPIVAFILSLMAVKSIKKDEALIKSMDRIR